MRSATNWTNSVRGDVYHLKKPRSAQGHEQQGERYAVVVQANAYEHLSTWLVAPTTTKSFGSMIHPTIELLGQDVRVLVEQTTAVDPQRFQDALTKFLARLHDLVEAIDDVALAILEKGAVRFAERPGFADG